MAQEKLIDMTGKICIVTGANSGVGKETSRKLVKQGAHLVMVCRNEAKAKAAREELLKSSPGATIDIYIADMAVIADVKKVADEILNNYERINLLVNNAGAHLMKREKSVDGYEMNFAVNYLGGFLLTNLLIDRIKLSAPARIVNVASEAHRIGSYLKFEDFQSENSPISLAYMRAKFYVMLYTQSMVRKLEGSGVSINSVCPGIVASNFFSGGPLKPFFGALAKGRIFTINTPEKGARSSIIAAMHPDYAEKSGDFIASHPLTKPFRAMKKVNDVELQDKLWQVSEEITGFKSESTI